MPMLPIACGICGDPTADTMLVQVALASGMSLPFVFRDRLTALVRRRLGGRTHEAESCSVPGQDETGPDQER